MLRISSSLTLLILSFAGDALAKTQETKTQGLHTRHRILIPADDSQERNFVVHKNIKKGKVTAPLLWIDYVPDATGKSRTMRLQSQNNLSTGNENSATQED